MSRRRRKQLANLGPDGLPLPLRWRPRVRIFGILSGLLGGLGTVVLIQQYGIAPLGRALTLQGLIGGAVSGVLIPSLVFGVVVYRYNRKLAAARGRLFSRASGAYGVGMALIFTTVCTAFAVLATAPALAEISGPCELIVNGIDVRNIALTPADAIPVVSEDPVTGYISTPSDFRTFEVRFYYAGFSYGFGDSEIDEGPDGGGGNGTFELPADLLFRYAGGLYEVRARGPLASGQYCEYAMLFDVDRNPFETPVGKAAAGATALGAVGVMGVAVGAAVDGGRMIGDLGSVLAGLPDMAGVDSTGDGVIDKIRVDTTADGTFDTTVDVWESSPPPPVGGPMAGPEISTPPPGPGGYEPVFGESATAHPPAAGAAVPVETPAGPSSTAWERPGGGDGGGAAPPEMTGPPSGKVGAGRGGQVSQVGPPVAAGGEGIFPTGAASESATGKVGRGTSSGWEPPESVSATSPGAPVESVTGKAGTGGSQDQPGGQGVVPPEAVGESAAAGAGGHARAGTEAEPIGEPGSGREPASPIAGPPSGDAAAGAKPSGAPQVSSPSSGVQPTAESLGTAAKAASETPAGLGPVERLVPPLNAGAPPVGAVGAGQIGMASAAVVGPAAVGSLARAVRQRAAGNPGGDAYWFYVEEVTPMFGLTGYEQVAGQLTPGTWHLAKATFEGWVLAVDDASGREGWVALQAVRRT